jgi:flagellar hook assembly protein FlgD
VYDVLGREVKVLVDRTQDAGVYSTKWSGTDMNGLPVAKGLYFLRMTAGAFTATKSIMLTR